jgi:ABC-2 type transport system permease protein
MLWYKAWLETRTRFLIGFLGITVLASWSIHNQVKDALPISGISYYYFVLHNCHQLLTFLWIIAMTMLMMGGLVREKSAGASSFTWRFRLAVVGWSGRASRPAWRKVAPWPSCRGPRCT